MCAYVRMASAGSFVTNGSQHAKRTLVSTETALLWRRAAFSAVVPLDSQVWTVVCRKRPVLVRHVSMVVYATTTLACAIYAFVPLAFKEPTARSRLICATLIRVKTSEHVCQTRQALIIANVSRSIPALIVRSKSECAHRIPV